MKRLSGKQFKRLQEALLSAFPSEGDLEMMVRIQLDQNLAYIAGGDNLEQTVYQLIKWAEKTGKIEELVKQAHEYRPGNEELAAFFNELKNIIKHSDTQQAVIEINEAENHQLPITLRQEIIEFLASIPNINDKSTRRALLEYAGLDVQLKNQLPVDEPPSQFLPLLVSTSNDYGELEDGRNALVAVLDAAKQYVGKDKREHCDALIQELRGITPPSQNELDLVRLRADYLTYLRQNYTNFDLRGIPQIHQLVQQVPLLDIYIPLKAYNTHDLHAIRRTDVTQVTSEKPILIEEEIKKHPTLVVLGDPGSGKSTLLKILLLKLLDNESDGRLPIILPLNAYARHLQQDGTISILAYLSEYYVSCQQKLVGIEKLFKTVLHKQQALILLDGLDEVQTNRLYIVKRIEDLALEIIPQVSQSSFSGGNCIVVTSRIVGYKESPLSAQQWPTYHLTNFDRNDIEQFITKWTNVFAHLVKNDPEIAAQSAQQERTTLLATIFSRPDVERLATNPLMLTILACLKYQGLALPDERVRLYNAYLETLITNWNRVRALDHHAVGPQMEYGYALQVLGSLAIWWRQENPTANHLNRQELKNWLTNYFCSEEWDLNKGEAGKQADLFLQDIEQSSSLLVEWGEYQYRFLHLTLEEMVVAHRIIYLLDNDFTTGLTFFHQYLLDPNWHEILLLAIGIIGVLKSNNKQAETVLQELLHTNLPAENMNRQIIFVGEALLDMGKSKIRPPVVQKIIQALLQAMHSHETPVLTRYQAGDLLGRLGDPRQEVLTLPPALTTALNGNFQGGKYLITNAQFAEFIRAKGYVTAAWWSDDGWLWQQHTHRQQPEFWEDTNFNNPNQPVVGVSWYEAEAFCRWLSGQTNAQYRLPTEAEWEFLAQGQSAHEYPWGDAWTACPANTEESGIGRTSAVGLFPEGINLTGAYDCAGNVWEWCDDWYDEQQNRKVLRGGAWNYSKDDARCWSRSGDLPQGSLNNVGFRVIYDLENSIGGELHAENSHNS